MSRRGRGLRWVVPVGCPGGLFRWVVPVGFSWVRVSGTPSTHVQQELPSRHLSAGHQRHRSPALGDSNNCVPGPSPGVRLLASVSLGPSAVWPVWSCPTNGRPLPPAAASRRIIRVSRCISRRLMPGSTNSAG